MYHVTRRTSTDSDHVPGRSFPQTPQRVARSALSGFCLHDALCLGRSVTLPRCFPQKLHFVPLPSNLPPACLKAPTFARLLGRPAFCLSGTNSSLSSSLSFSDHLDRFRADLLDGPAAEEDGEQKGGGLGKEGEEGEEGEEGGVMSNIGRGLAETTGAGGVSGSMAVSMGTSTSGRGLKISEGEIVR